MFNTMANLPIRSGHQRNRHKPLVLGPEDIEWQWSPQGLRTGIFSKDTTRSMVLASYVTQTRERSAKSTATFLKFPELPAEIRIKIWAFTVVPRLVGVQLIKEFDDNGDNAGRDRMVSETPVPAIMHVNMEARTEALKYYSLQFSTAAAPATTYFNWALDTLYIHKSMNLNPLANTLDPGHRVNLSVEQVLSAGVSGEETSQLHSIVVNQGLIHTISAVEPGVFGGFTALKQIIVVKGEFDVAGPSRTSLIMKLWPEHEMRVEESRLKTLLRVDITGPKLAWRVPVQVILQ